MLLKALREEVLCANLALPKNGLVTFTWGNVSGIDHEQGLVVIKPSGVSYEAMQINDMVVVDMQAGLPHSNIIKASGQACSCVNHHPRQRLCAAGADWSSSFQAERAG